jgi:2-octaprenyl-6-methoxyphenol hydroxylase
VHPLAGQGLNQGIKDIECLYKLLGSHELNPSLLAKYSREREPDNIAMYFITDQINAIFSNNNWLFKIGRRAGLSIIESLSPIKSRILQYAMGER